MGVDGWERRAGRPAGSKNGFKTGCPATKTPRVRMGAPRGAGPGRCAAAGHGGSALVGGNGRCGGGPRHGHQM